MRKEDRTETIQSKRRPRTNAQFVSLKELSEEFGLSRGTLRRAFQKANIPAICFSDSRNGSIRYRREDVQTFIRKNGI